MSQSSLFKSSTIGTRKTLRDYQGYAIEAIFDYFTQHDGSPVVVLPVGGGKSLTIAEFMRESNVYFPPTRFIVLAHVSELLTQNAEELVTQWPEADIAFYSDSLGQKNLDADIVFAGIQSIYKKAYDFRHTVDLILVDEAHLISPDDSTMYRKFIDDMRAINPYIKIVGFTGTPFRPGYGMIHKGKNALFTHIVYEISIAELISRGHLVPIVTPDGGVHTKMDVHGVKKVGGDYHQGQLAKAVDDIALTKSCVSEIVAHGVDRKCWLVFTVDIEHCTHVRDEIRLHGINCEMIHSKTPTMERNRIVDMYKSGRIQCLVNVAVFTVGFNNPRIDMLAFMRPTRSPVLYIQMAGRGIRTHEFNGCKKHDCLLLDFGGVVEELGPIDAVRVKEPGPGGGDAPIKYCPGRLPGGAVCNATLPASLMTCNYCGYEFPENGLNLTAKPSEAAALSSQLKPKAVPVIKALYYVHKKEGRPDCLRVEYLSGMKSYREWVFFDSTLAPREKACAWWKRRTGTLPPRNSKEAVERAAELITPTLITVKKIGEYVSVVGEEFDIPAEAITKGVRGIDCRAHYLQNIRKIQEEINIGDNEYEHDDIHGA